jgi:nucleotide-binding universal stress UspA family protein
MKAQKILYPTDFSEAGRPALAMATSLARDTGATLIVAHVEEPPMAYGGGEMYYGVDQVDHEELRKSLAAVVPTDPSVPCVHKLLIGDPAEAILQLAESDHVDLIVMGTHGRRGLTRLLMGSVAEAVVRRAKCPVLTVKEPAEASAALPVGAA